MKELEENFRKEHENRIQAMNHVEKLIDYDTNVHYEIIKELEEAHKHIHESEEKSHTKYTERIAMNQQIHPKIENPPFSSSYGSISLQQVSSQAGSSSYLREGFSANNIQIVSPHQFYQYSEPSRESISIHSKNSIEEQLKESDHSPYIVSSNKLKK